jgi:hypothetical protein
VLLFILGRDVRVHMSNLATTSAWENHYLVVVAVQTFKVPELRRVGS